MTRLEVKPVPESVPDQEARDRIREDLGATLFVEAGAGSGKTAALVDRLVGLIVGGEAELSEIAAITFTEKAAAELRDRVRAKLTERSVKESGGPAAERCLAALDQLDGAPIGTLHAFCQRLLVENAVEAELPPRLEVLDEVSSSVAFEQRWRVFRDQLLVDPALERTLLLFVSSGVKIEALGYLAQAFEDNWDLVAERVDAAAPEPPPVKSSLEPVLAAARALGAGRCTDQGDLLYLHIQEIVSDLSELCALPDELAILERISPGHGRRLPSFGVGGKGKKQNWGGDVRPVQAAVRQLEKDLDAARIKVVTACAHRLAVEIRRFTLEGARARQQQGELRFHDLLVLARALLQDPRHGPSVRRRLHGRYRRILLDEFQDTDPIQIDVAVRIAAADPSADSSGQTSWEEVDVAPGRLFVVGDPKQSIYRFRRADITLFEKASRRFGRGGGDVRLTTNFRSVAPLIDWVNTTFGELIGSGDGDLQPHYVPLQAVRGTPPGGPAVAVLGRAPHDVASADELRAAEAADVADAVARIVEEEWAVYDDVLGWRPAQLGDIAVLVPARTSLPFLEDALDEAGIPFRAEASSLVYASRPVRDLLMVLRAVDDPTNELHVVSALRTPLLACGDDDLFRFRCGHRGHFRYLDRQPEAVPADDPVRLGLEYLRSLHADRHWQGPSELLERIARERRAFELGVAEGRARDIWRRLRYVVDQARAWSEATGGNLRQYLGWVERQSLEGVRASETVLPETDDDALRVMTIHAAKGLEFPVTVLSGMSTEPRRAPAPVQVVFPEPPGRVGYRFAAKVTTDEYERWKPIDELMSYHERIRLLYVAATRARDHLVVSLHRKIRKSAVAAQTRTNAELLVDGMGSLLDELPDAGPLLEPAEEEPASEQQAGVAAGGGPPEQEAPPDEPLLSFDTWAAERAAALERASQPRTVAATALTDEGTRDAEEIPEADAEPAVPAGQPPTDGQLAFDELAPIEAEADATEAVSDADPAWGLEKRPRDLDLPPWLKGRYGSAVGRAVHGVLQTVDLGDPRDLEAAVAAQCEAEAVVDRVPEVTALARAALGAPSVRAAAAAPHRREVYVCTPVEDRLLEGYVDLLYRTEGGLVVVDYKTASTSDSQELDRRVEGYRNQGASYALAVRAVTGEPVERVIFLFLTPDGAVERQLDRLEESVERVRSLVASGREVVLV